MDEIKLNLLGPPELTIAGQSVALGNRKSIALLAYLAVTATSHSRDSLAALLWPETDQIRARTYLRQSYHSLTKVIGSAAFQADRETLGMQPDLDLVVDVSCFHSHLRVASEIDPELSSAQALSALEEATALYRDSFMAGFGLPDSPAFDEWQYYERTTLQREMTGATLALAYGYGLHGEFQSAIA